MHHRKKNSAKDIPPTFMRPDSFFTPRSPDQMIFDLSPLSNVFGFLKGLLGRRKRMRLRYTGLSPAHRKGGQKMVRFRTGISLRTLALLPRFPFPFPFSFLILLNAFGYLGYMLLSMGLFETLHLSRSPNSQRRVGKH